MLTTIKGIYDNGKIILSEEPPVKTATEVMVTFLTAETKESSEPKRVLGGLEGKISVPADFIQTDCGTNDQHFNRKKNEVVFGSLKGKISVPEDFDEPLEDLKDYM